MPLRADLAELADWVEGLSAAAHKARDGGNITLAEALETTRFEVHQGYLEEVLNNRAKHLMIKGLTRSMLQGMGDKRWLLNC
jgi:hypothetical protein